ncbi:multidrug efflux ABC transporter permease [Amycolatopsis ultiminotia]|uniref:Multidrug efflux ABC transporter permease n=1 Tax=Amycolatopsis ultiminotia TaxID=543629 RepID=A0ABP6XLY2_9PSEU
MSELTGARSLVRLILRRDRFILPLWIVLAVVVPSGVATGAANLYRTSDELRRYTEEALGNPAEVAMRGLIYAPTLGGVTAWGTGMAGALIAGVASLFLVIRHTRVEEETGRRELLGSTVLGRHAGLTAALSVVVGANLVVALVLAAALTGIGLPFGGGLVLGLSTAGTGIAIAAVAGIAAQMTAGAGAARGLAFAALAVLFLLRAIGDSGNGAASWLSPFGWARLSRAFTGDRWWVLLLFAGFAMAATTIAYFLAARRDNGAGLIPARPGPPSASSALRGMFALTWRTRRGAVLAWAVACAAVGALLGGSARDAAEQVSGLFSGANALFSFTFLVLSQAVTAFTIMTMLSLRTEEGNGLAELLLATAPSRYRWAGAHVAVALTGSVVMLAAVGVASGLTYGASVGDISGEVPRLLGAALVWLPAVWITAGIALALVGLLPKAAIPVSWLVLGAFLALELAYEFGQVNKNLLDISPFSHTPRILLGTPLTFSSMTIPLLVAVALSAAGLLGVRRRDIG